MYKRSSFSKNLKVYFSCNNVKVGLVLVFKLLFVYLLQIAIIDVEVFVYNHVNKKDLWLLKEQILKRLIISPFVPPFCCT